MILELVEYIELTSSLSCERCNGSKNIFIYLHIYVYEMERIPLFGLYLVKYNKFSLQWA